MVLHVQPQQNLTQVIPNLAQTPRARKPSQPVAPAKWFLLDKQPATPIQQVSTPPIPLPQSAQETLKECYEQARHDLSRLYKQAKPQQQHTPAEQMLFEQSHRDVVGQLEILYAQAIGQQALQPKQQLQDCYAQTMATLRLFSRLVQQSPDAFAQLKQRFYQIYVQAQKQRPQVMKPHVKVPVPQIASKVSTPPPSSTGKTPSPTPLVRPAMSVSSSSLDESICRPWKPEELQRLQQVHQVPSSVPQLPQWVKPQENVSQPSPSARPQGQVSQPPQLIRPQGIVSQPPQSIRPQRSVPQAAPRFTPQQSHPAVQAQRGTQSNVTSPSPAPTYPTVVNTTQTTNAQSAQRSSQRDRQQSWDPRASRREYLLRERTYLEREVQRVLGNADALSQRWQFWHAQKAQLEQDKGSVPVKEAFSFVVRRLVKIPLPSAARNISYRESRLTQECTWLNQQAIAINARYAALLEEIKVIDTELEMLQF